MTSPGLFTRIFQAIDIYRAERQTLAMAAGTHEQRGRRWLPSPGNALFSLLLIFGLLYAQNAQAFSLGSGVNTASTSTIAYQGRLADVEGNPLTETTSMTFRLYDTAGGGDPLWTEQWTGSNGVQVSDGLFNVMLGSLTPIPHKTITASQTLFLGISVGTDAEMSPRVQLGSVPFATQALTVPDGSITAEKLAEGVLDSSKIDLASGTACLSAPSTLSLPGGGFVFRDIPGLTLSFSLNQPSKVLIWIDGTAKFTNGNSNAAVEVNVDGQRKLATIVQRGVADWWFNISDQKILELPVGAHKLQGVVLSSDAGTFTIFGSGGGNDPYDTCINYLVLGE